MKDNNNSHNNNKVLIAIVTVSIELFAKFIFKYINICGFATCLSCGCYWNRNFKFPFKFSKCSDIRTDPPDRYLKLQIWLAAINL